MNGLELAGQLLIWIKSRYDTDRVIYNLKRLTPLSLVTTATPDVSLRIRQTTKIVFIIMLAIELTAFPSSPPQNGRGMR